MPLLYQHQLDQALIALSKLKEIDDGAQLDAFRIITEEVSKHLGVERVSIWLIDQSKTSFICSDLYSKVDDKHSRGTVLKVANSPLDLTSLENGKVFTSSQVSSTNESKKIVQSYLKAVGVKSLLVAPITVEGHIIGVVCVGRVQEDIGFSYSEERFIGNISYIISRAVLAREKLDLFINLEQKNQELMQRTKQLEDERQRSEHAYKMASLGEMAGGIAHEINNPLTIIKANADLLLTLLKKGAMEPAEMENALGKIKRTCSRIELIIKGLKFFSRDNKNDDRTKESFKSILEDTLAICREKFMANGCEIIVENSSVESFLECQTVSISQAILNLLNNAFDVIKDMDEKWIKIQIQNRGNSLQIRLTDSGKGIPLEIQAKIFQPFFSTKPMGKGTGLGLAIVKGIIDQHAGQFYLDQESKNTCFVIELPIAA